MGRRPCCDKTTVKRGAWSPEEDAALKLYVQSHGSGGNWITLPQKAGLRRCGKSCRLRWLNYLRPNIKHGGFTHEEDSIICTLYNQIGSRWSVIASRLPGRTDNDVKNYWNTKLKKKMISAGLLRLDPGENVNYKHNDNYHHHHQYHSSSIINEPRFEFDFDFPNHFDQCYSYLFPKQPDHQIDTYSDLITPIGFYTNGSVDVERSSSVSDFLECKQPVISDNSEAFHGYDGQLSMDIGFGTGSGFGFPGHDEKDIQRFTEAAGAGSGFQSHGFAYGDDIMKLYQELM